MTAFIIEALCLCALFAAFIIPVYLKNPLAWVEDLPPAIGQRARELGLVKQGEKQGRRKFIAEKSIKALCLILILALVLRFVNGAEGFWQGFALGYGLWFIVAWFDALVIDMLWLPNSPRARIPGTEDMERAWRDYGFHARMSLRGSLMGIPVCLAGAGLNMLLGLLF